MRQNILKRTVAALLTAAVSVVGMPGAVVQGQSTVTVSDFIEVEAGDASEYGLVPERLVDPQGNEVTPDLIPEYGLRASASSSSYDLRTETGLPAIRNQNPTGSCWAHAAIGSIESQLIKSGRATTNINLSEAHLVWFSRGSYVTDANDPLYHDGDNLGTDAYNAGGNSRHAIAALASWSGYVDEKLVPSVTTSPAIEDEYRYDSEGHLQNTESYDTSDLTAIKNAIATTGALYASYYTDENAENVCLYKKYVNGAYNYSYYCSDASKDENHGVLLIGWDDDYSAANFNPSNKPSKNGAWLCRNSWGTSWGSKGYFWMSYEDATLRNITSFRVEPVNNYDHNYQYDGSYSALYYDEEADVTTGANVFTAGKEDHFAAVSFMTTYADTAYTIKVYTNLKGDSPTSGTLALTDTGTALYAGYHTFSLSKLIDLTEGKRFSVIVSVDKGGIWMDNNSISQKYSYIWYNHENKYQWVAASNGGSGTRNVCIKAFTYEGLPIDAAHFPDEAMLRFAESCDTNQNGYLSSTERLAVKTADLSLSNLSNLQGIEYFENLTSLDCSENPMAFADVSALKSLKTFTCDGCVLFLDQTSCTTLSTLGLDISKMSHLEGAEISSDGKISPYYGRGDTISYTYDCGGGFSAVFEIDGVFTHNYTSAESVDEIDHDLICADCGYRFREWHDLSDWTDQKDGTHAQVCEACGYKISEAHTFNKWADNKDGTHKRTCSVCKGVETEAHRCTKWTDAGDGTHTGTCADCSAAMKEAHTFGAYKTDAKGNHYRTCTGCGYVETAAHTFGKYTANKDGTHTHTCTVCGFAESAAHDFTTYTSQDSSNHQAKCKDCGYTETQAHHWNYVNNPLQGDHSLVCDDCGYTSKTMNEAHTLGDATDNKDGTHSQTCTLCGGVVTAAHIYGDYTVNKDGTHTRVCTVCGSKETAKHSLSKWADAGDGTHLRECVCGYTERSSHTFGDYTVNEDGTHTHSCTVCGYTESAKHTFGDYTDNADGTHTRACKDCGYAESGEHIYGTKYTINKDGTHSLTCTKCGHVEAEAHTFGKCTDNGNGTHTHICSVCKYVENKAHTYGAYKVVDGVTTRECKDCGAKDYLYGDADGDLKLTVKDLVILQKYLLGLTTSVTNLSALDVDGNGVVDIFDLAYLKRALLAKS